MVLLLALKLLVIIYNPVHLKKGLNIFNFLKLKKHSVYRYWNCDVQWTRNFKISCKDSWKEILVSGNLESVKSMHPLQITCQQ